MVATPGALLNIGTGTKQNRFELQTAHLGDGAITTISVASLNGGFTDDTVFTNADGSGVVFAVQEGAPLTSVDAGGARSELREMALDGTTEMAFDATLNDNWISGSSRVTAGPDGHLNGVVIAQMHDTSSDNIEICTQLSGGVIKLLCRINGTSVGMPTLNNLYMVDINTPGPWVDWKIRVGSFGYKIYINDFTNPIIDSTTSGMPALTISGLCYFKAGVYTQCKDTDIVDSTRYSKVELKNLKHWHTGWPDPSYKVPTVVGPCRNIRLGANTVLANNPNGQTITAPFPTSTNAPVDGDLIILVSRAVRMSSTTSTVSQPGLDTATSTGWGWTSKFTDFLSNQTVNTSPTTLVTRSIRHRVWYTWWQPNLPAPVVTYTATTLTDVFGAQLIVVTGALQTGDPFDQTGVLTAAATASTTLAGPAPALTNPVPAGAAVFALVDHENALSSGGVATLTGDGLTWTEGQEFAGTSPASHAWAVDWAVAAASTSIGAKTAAITVATGKGAGQHFSILPAPGPTSNLLSRLRKRNRPLLVR